MTEVTGAQSDFNNGLSEDDPAHPIIDMNTAKKYYQEKSEKDMNFINKDLKKLKPSDSEGESGDLRANFDFEASEKFREEYGFDYVELWNFDQTLARFLYAHLKAYLRLEPHDLDYHTFQYNGKTYTERQMIKKIIKGCKAYIQYSFVVGKKGDKAVKKFKKSLQMLAECFGALWI